MSVRFSAESTVTRTSVWPISSLTSSLRGASLAWLTWEALGGTLLVESALQVLAGIWGLRGACGCCCSFFLCCYFLSHLFVFVLFSLFLFVSCIFSIFFFVGLFIFLFFFFFITLFLSFIKTTA